MKQVRVKNCGVPHRGMCFKKEGGGSDRSRAKHPPTVCHGVFRSVRSLQL